jgi:hypothetical protein
MVEAAHVSGPNPVLIDKFLDGAVEVDVDAITDGVDVYIAGVMQQIEEAGVHSLDRVGPAPRGRVIVAIKKRGHLGWPRDCRLRPKP